VARTCSSVANSRRAAFASRLGEGHFFFVGEMHHRLLISGQLQNEARNIVLFIGQERPHRFNRVIE